MRIIWALYRACPAVKPVARASSNVSAIVLSRASRPCTAVAWLQAYLASLKARAMLLSSPAAQTAAHLSLERLFQAPAALETVGKYESLSRIIQLNSMYTFYMQTCSTEEAEGIVTDVLP